MEVRKLKPQEGDKPEHALQALEWAASVVVGFPAWEYSDKRKRLYAVIRALEEHFDAIDG